MRRIVLSLSLIAGLPSLLYLDAMQPEIEQFKRTEQSDLADEGFDELTDQKINSKADDALVQELLAEGKHKGAFSAAQVRIAFEQIKILQAMQKQMEKDGKKKKDKSLLGVASDAFWSTARDTTQIIVTYGIALPISFFVSLQAAKLYLGTGLPQYVFWKTFWSGVTVTIEVLDSIGGSKGFIKVPAYYLGLI